MSNEYDIIVVGGGHAGCEAAAIAAKLGSRVLLISMDLTKLAQMSCNPAIGGVGKGQIVREIDALGGLTGIVTDLTTIHFRMLNTSKGAAMWSPRAQCDRIQFTIEWRKQLEGIRNLFLIQDEVMSLDVDSKTSKISGLFTKNGNHIRAKSVILTNGTFLNGLIHIGKTSFQGGRIGEPPSNGLSDQLKKLGFSIGRMKTGTPVRVDGRTVNYSKLIEQTPDEKGKFSFNKDINSKLPQRSCFIAHTNRNVHEELRKGFLDSPLFSGTIKGVGPRYCPSIEDKVHTFWKRESHQLFLEPDGADTYEMYLNGFSSSLPIEVQYNSLKLIMGFENVEILRPGYAIEYDFFQPTQLKPTLESKIIKNLYFAGQINGTTGYEEAAGQGIVAGINAHLKISDKEEFIIKRDKGYIGVMIDDLVVKGVDEPYRVFTSRAEFRILIRQDNADERLTPYAEKLGLISESQYDVFKDKYRRVEKMISDILKLSVDPKDINDYLRGIGSSEIKQRKKLKDIILRPEISLKHILSNIEFANKSLLDFECDEILESAEIKIKYEGYIEKEKGMVEKNEKLEHIRINQEIDYFKLESLSTEARQKLTKIRPKTIGEAQRIPGVSPSDINVLLVYFGR
jgi:tRNA uridine 5-carboxymethylaminomethyl modification enzyme